MSLPLAVTRATADDLHNLSQLRSDADNDTVLAALPVEFLLGGTESNKNHYMALP